MNMYNTHTHIQEREEGREGEKGERARARARKIELFSQRFGIQ